jgi:hypothetical protein
MALTKHRVAQIQSHVAAHTISKYEQMLLDYDRFADFTWPTKAEIEDKLLNAMIRKEEADNILNQ